jgi:hypothetical protein
VAGIFESDPIFPIVAGGGGVTVEDDVVEVGDEVRRAGSGDLQRSATIASVLFGVRR